MIFGIIGGGVVGQATRAYLEMKGHEVRVYDVDRDKRDCKWINLQYCDYLVLCVPTPGRDGRLDVSILTVFGMDVEMAKWDMPIIIRSTIPLGYTQRFEEMSGCPTIYWPEFLTERTAEEDALNPVTTVIGYTEGHIELANDFQIEIDAGYSSRKHPSNEVELIKLLSNTYGAVIVSLMNEFHSICQDSGADWETVRGGLLRTGRILEVYSHVPGPDGKRGWGGKCWPKDVDEVANMTGRSKFSIIREAALRNQVDRGEE